MFVEILPNIMLESNIQEFYFILFLYIFYFEILFNQTLFFNF